MSAHRDRRPELAPLSPEEVRDRLSGMSERDANPGTVSAPEAFAATRVFFDTDQLIRVSEDPEAALRVVSGAHRARDPEGNLAWQLGDTERRQTLRRLSEQGTLEKEIAQTQTNQEADPLQQMLNRVATGVRVPLDDMGRDELILLDRVVSWLEGSLEKLPDRGEIKRMIARLELLQPFERLVGDHFAGRETELTQLRSFVDALRSESSLETVSRFVRTVTDAVFTDSRRPLMIHGPGGVGKSTLLAKFILDHAMPQRRTPSFPFVYIDLDRPSNSIARVNRLLVEAVTQISMQESAPSGGSQAPDAGRFAELAETWRRRPQSGAGASRSSDGPRGEQRHTAEFLSEFAALLRDGPWADRPLLLVIDTFEEAQYGTPEHVDAFLEFLARFRDQVPMLRVVIAGRSRLDSDTLQHMPLGSFDRESGVAYLTHQGVGQDAARRIVRQVGTSPLSLRLAVSLYNRTGAQGLDGVKDARFFGRLSQEQIQGQLFRRILNHIHSPTVRALAHPGLMLRKITPRIIREVLAPHCGLGKLTEAAAGELFAELRREVALVESADTGGSDSLAHRTDVRRTMLGLILADKKTEARAIDRAAAEYYASLEPTAENQAEELYHRISLGDDTERVRELATPELLGNLESAAVDYEGREAQRLFERLRSQGAEDERRSERGQRDAIASAWRSLANLEIDEARSRMPDAPDSVQEACFNAHWKSLLLDWESEIAILKSALFQAAGAPSPPAGFGNLLHRWFDARRRLGADLEDVFVFEAALRKDTVPEETAGLYPERRAALLARGAPAPTAPDAPPPDPEATLTTEQLRLIAGVEGASFYDAAWRSNWVPYGEHSYLAKVLRGDVLTGATYAERALVFLALQRFAALRPDMQSHLGYYKAESFMTARGSRLRELTELLADELEMDDEAASESGNHPNESPSQELAKVRRVLCMAMRLPRPGPRWDAVELAARSTLEGPTSRKRREKFREQLLGFMPRGRRGAFEKAEPASCARAAVEFAIALGRMPDLLDLLESIRAATRAGIRGRLTRLLELEEHRPFTSYFEQDVMDEMKQTMQRFAESDDAEFA